MTSESQYGLTSAEMRQFLDWIHEQGIQLLSLEQFLHNNEPGLLLTFDDGKANNATNLMPILEEFDAPAVFFVTTQHIRDPRNWLTTTQRFASTQWPDLMHIPDAIAQEYYDGMSPDQLITCDQHPLITIGAHTETHPHLPDCDITQLDDELTGPKQYLEDLLGHPVDTIAYPFGEYNQQVAEATRDAGYTHAFTINPHPVKMPNYEIPRLYIGMVEPFYITAKISGLFKRPIQKLEET